MYFILTDNKLMQNIMNHIHISCTVNIAEIAVSVISNQYHLSFLLSFFLSFFLPFFLSFFFISSLFLPFFFLYFFFPSFFFLLSFFLLFLS